MASRQDSLQYLSSCVVCLEEFEEDGDHIPRLLPCTHTLCEICLKQLIRSNKIECPECRAKHEAPREEKNFPQNKYLLIQVKRKSGNEGKVQPDREKKELCEEHRKELILFCNEPECKKPICLVCLKKSHKKHDVTDIVDEKRDVLKKKISYIEKNLREKISGLNTAKCEVSRKTEACLGNLEKRREEVIDEIDKQFEKMKKEAKDQLKKANNSIENEVIALNENLNLLSIIKQNTDMDDENDDSYSDVIDMIETVEGVKDMINQCLSGHRTYSSPDFIATPVSFGNIVTATYDMKLSQIEEDAMLMETHLGNVTDTSQLKCTGEYKIISTTVLHSSTSVKTSDGVTIIKLTKYFNPHGLCWKT